MLYKNTFDALSKNIDVLDALYYIKQEKYSVFKRKSKVREAQMAVLIFLSIIGIPLILAWVYLRAIKKQSREDAVGNVVETALVGVFEVIIVVALIIWAL